MNRITVLRGSTADLDNFFAAADFDGSGVIDNADVNAVLSLVGSVIPDGIPGQEPEVSLTRNGRGRRLGADGTLGPARPPISELQPPTATAATAVQTEGGVVYLGRRGRAAAFVSWGDELRGGTGVEVAAVSAAELEKALADEKLSTATGAMKTPG